jgi:oligopeptide transport system ATP-binding protein
LADESGCGKSTTGLGLLRVLTPTGGRLVFEGTDITAFGQNRMQLMYQDPFGLLDPRMRVRGIIAEPLEVHGMTGGAVSVWQDWSRWWACCRRR